MDQFFTEEQRMVRDTARKLSDQVIAPAAAAIDRDDVFPRAIYETLAEQGLFGVALPEEAGGVGLDAMAACIVMEEIARGSGAVGNAFAIPVEAALFLNHHGSEETRKWIPGIVEGRVIPATAVTEPDCGSDVAAMKTTARRDGDDYVIKGTKAWVTFGEIADVVMVFAKTDPEAGHRGISCILVETDRPGVHRGKSEDLLGMHGLADCMLSFDEVRVPVANRIGPEHGAFKMAMENFNFSRLMMSSMALGMAQAAMEDAVAYANDRRQFGKPIFDFQAIQFMIADMSKDIAAARLLIHHAAKLYDAGHPIALEAAQAKLFTTDMAQVHISNALQIHGGNGYSREFRIERLFRDVRLSQIYEGTNQIQRMIIARQVQKACA
ncbi:acyl-CoA dehydrogenase family protein [Rhodovulum sulfidophilum]|uniref:acyl-CoA dehydrogenase family protein n=1 Tax=Rhodovulum sulfidophilum TaxID=35806 RepID=UPI001921725E|nr:acyl-CoA dehydrogenase family protein [Rhodovulum sulfidophilum]MBL3574901.1 acyl-CoA dehydrogenase family protein [Rhodovulum sulfidophilum]MBL3596163.1 acyl-CoA dehydrogenase family protein [Rhodovulum sulfidophilum]MCE8431070.1 acyl-CoA dehydrogenase family protein [Rhodovulum sulfidophilum]MCE8438400.1 acyl-CoA dehydrogenase family protein [Rhodovulum sulfidophilum]MCE8469305.1 acyl-CoA dehydrogenase family protein [Rhodovulum sulfidophilum]